MTSISFVCNVPFLIAFSDEQMLFAYVEIFMLYKF